MIFRGVDLRCPRCRGELERRGEESLDCPACHHVYSVLLGIPDLRVFPDPYIDLAADHAKGRRLAEESARVDFRGLLDFYYSITPAVPAHHARLYTQGLLAAEERARAALDSWEGPGGQAADLLEIGCGTGPLLVAAATRYTRAIGVDIAFRWLVVAKKRLEEAGVDAPVVAACGERLPFGDRSFDRVVADSAIEVVADPRKAVDEAFRVLRPGGRLFVSTPNRTSLGPDPHTGIWAGGWLPDRWTAAIVRRQGGVPPRRLLLTAASLRRLLSDAGFRSIEIRLPDVTDAQRERFGPAVRRMIGAYHTAKRLPVTRAILTRIGPLLHAVATKP